MTKYPWWYNLWYLVWFLPAYFVLMGLYQLSVYEGIHHTLEEGSEYQAVVTGFDIKQIAAQTNGYIDLRFETAENGTVEQRLALPIQMAQVLMDYSTIPVSYEPDSRHPILILPTFELQRNIIRVNLAVNLIGLLVTFVIAWIFTRNARTRLKTGREDMVIERVDNPQKE